jgi:hypothetical protein
VSFTRRHESDIHPAVPQILPISDLAERHQGVTPAIGECFTEAARVCLDRHHESPIEFALHDNGAGTAATVDWEKTDDRCKAAYANETDTTEWGAYACALAASELSRGLIALRRAETKTGADFYLAAPGTSLTDLEDCVRLEVSGIDKGTPRDVEIRLLQKVAQARAGESNLPALATVVGFKAQRIAVKDVGEGA